MDIRWKTLITQCLIWIAAEIFLSYLGLDNLADYGEFLLSHDELVIRVMEHHPVVAETSLQLPQSRFQWDRPIDAYPHLP